MKAGTTSGTTTPCLVCGALLYSYPSRLRKHCGRACRDASKRRATYNDAARVKHCARCALWLPFAEFAASGKNLQAYCRGCGSAKTAEWAAANPEAKMRHKRESYARDPEKARALKRNMSAEARTKKNARQRAYCRANPDKIRLLNRLQTHLRRAVGAMPDRYDVGYMVCEQDGRCVYCNTGLHEYHIDHKTPVSRRGTNDRANLQLLCPGCNLKKSDKTHEEFLLADVLRRIA